MGGKDNDDFSADWQTFWAMMLTSVILVLCFKSVRGDTALTDNKIFQIFAVAIILNGFAAMNSLFGIIGFNPAFACAYIMFEAAEYNDPNVDYNSTGLTHYLWAYCIGPLVGGFAGGIIYWFHRQTAQGEFKDISEGFSRLGGGGATVGESNKSKTAKVNTTNSSLGNSKPKSQPQNASNQLSQQHQSNDKDTSMASNKSRAKFCSECGARFDGEAQKFCSECGNQRS